MKKLFLLFCAVLIASSAYATIGTYPGELEKQGPKAELVVGYASDQPATIEIEVEKKSGLNISHLEDFDFRPKNISRVVQRGDQQLSLKEFNIEIVSDNPQRELYEIPVTLRAFNPGTGGEGATPQIIQEREYIFEYRTEFSPTYGYEGDLIDRNEENNTGESPDETLNISEENSLTDDNQTDTQGETEEPESGLNPVLVALVVLVFGYVIYEAFT